MKNKKKVNTPPATPTSPKTPLTQPDDLFFGSKEENTYHVKLDPKKLNELRSLTQEPIPTDAQLIKMKTYLSVYNLEEETKDQDVVEFIFKQGKPKRVQNAFTNRQNVINGLFLLGAIDLKKFNEYTEGSPANKKRKTK